MNTFVCLPSLIFSSANQGEEITIGIRGFTHGYDFYAPQASVVFHEYADNSKRRSKIHMFWENGQKHQGAARKSLARAMSIIKMAPDIDPSSYDHTEMERYGLGNGIEKNYKPIIIDIMAYMFRSSQFGVFLQTLFD